MRFSRPSLPRTVASLGLAALVFLPPPVPSRDTPGWERPAWWDVRIRLETRGRYAVTQDMTDFSGEYAYEALWSGIMEGDGPDYILYHASPETLRWEMKERPGRDGAGGILSEKDFPVHPVFRMNYVLGEAGRLRFFFTVEGFPVPRNDSPEKFALILPCSRKESPASSAAGYDAAVSGGSNDISLDERELRNGPIESVFRWEWKRYTPSSAPPPAGPLFNTHEARVTLTITPHR
jgi:hypothetical protein